MKGCSSAAKTFIDLCIGWEWSAKEERRDLVCKMIQEAGCDVGTKCIVWVKVNPDYEILFWLMDRLRPNAGRRYWIAYPEAVEDTCDTREDLGQMGTEVKIVFPMSHNTRTSVEEYV